MILLSFGNIVKFMFSVLLATLGIIPYDAVYVNSDYQAHTIRQARLAANGPLARMEPLPFPDDLMRSGLQQRGDRSMALIPARRQHPVDCRPVAPAPWCSQTYVVTCAAGDAMPGRFILVQQFEREKAVIRAGGL